MQSIYNFGAVITSSILFMTAIAVLGQAPIVTQAASAFASNPAVKSITLGGTFLSSEGSLREEGNAHLIANSDGTYFVSLTQKTGMAKEQRSLVNSQIVCTWQDSSGNDHQMDRANCQTPAWFLPELPIFLSSSPRVEWALSAQSDDGSTQHLRFDYNLVTRKDHASPSPVHVLDMELSKTTLLPTKALYFVHADRRPGVVIPIEITYEDFRSVNGVNIPFRIRKFVNGTLVLDITLSSANVN